METSGQNSKETKTKYHVIEMVVNKNILAIEY